MFAFLRKLLFGETFNKNLTAFCTTLLLFALANGLIGYYLPIHVTNYLGSLTRAGVLISLAFVINIAIDVLFGLLAPRTKTGTFVKFTFFALVMFAIGNLFALHISVVLFSVVLWGVLSETNQFSIFNYTVRNSMRESYGYVYGFMSIFSSFGAVVGPLVASILFVINTAFIFYTIIALALLGLMVNLFLVETRKDLFTLPQKKALRFLNEWHVWRNLFRENGPILFVYLSLGMFRAMTAFLAPLLALQKYNLGALSGSLISAFVLPQLLFQKYSGRFAQREQKAPIISIGFNFAAVCLLVFAMTTNYIAALALALLAASAINIVSPAILSSLSEAMIKHKKEHEETVGQALAFSNFGYIIGALTAGYTADTFTNLSAPFFVLAVALSLSAVLLWIEQRKVG